MAFLWVVLGIILFLYFVVWFLYYRVFSARGGRAADVTDSPDGTPYAAYRAEYARSLEAIRARPCEAVTIRSFDGLELAGRYFPGEPGAPLRILFHGYRTLHAESDFCCGMEDELERGRAVLLADERGQGRSQGDTITFGVLERQDCLAWCRYAAERFGTGTPVILGGMSMGAAAVLMASALELPGNVRGIIADSGFTSPREIICKVIRQMGLPARPLYPLVRLGAKIFGRFDPDSASALEAVRHTRIPILFIHGEDDQFVPCDMARRLYEACASDKRLVTVPGADHGLSYLVDRPAVDGAIREFCGRVLAADRQQ